MGDMITAAFNDGEGYKRVPGLWQWDRGQTLKICGLDFQNKTMEVHFAIAGSETAKTVIGEVKENHILAKIPDTLLKNGRNIWAFLYLADTKSGQTIRQIECVVNKRPKPEDYEEPEEEHILEELLEQLNKKGDRLYLEENRMQLFLERIYSVKWNCRKAGEARSSQKMRSMDCFKEKEREEHGKIFRFNRTWNI